MFNEIYLIPGDILKCTPARNIAVEFNKNHISCAVLELALLSVSQCLSCPLAWIANLVKSC